MSLQLNLTRLTKKARQKLSLMNHRIGSTIDELYKPDALILFGSYAHGQPDEWSDVDLLFISQNFAATPKLRRRSQFLINTGAYLHEGMNLEPLCLTPEELLQGIQWATIEREALEMGLVVLDRTGIAQKAAETIIPTELPKHRFAAKSGQLSQLGQADVEQIRLTLSVPAGQRMRNMLDMQNLLLNIWHDRMRKAHPELSDLERTRLVYRRLAQNG